MTNEQREKLQQILAALDENALIALKNKGLVRRAAKDLADGGLTHEEIDEAILVHGQGWTVTMPPEGPTRATDDTKATGITRQILTAILYLQQEWLTDQPGEKSIGPDESLEEAILAITTDDLQKWGGKTTLREAMPLTENATLEVEQTSGLTLRLVKHEIEARLLPGHSSTLPAKKLLDQILTTAPKSQHKKWAIVAVLAFQRSRGIQATLPEASSKKTSEGPRTREEILLSVQRLLESMIATGLAHPSERLVGRLTTLSVSSTGAHLPRLARLLRSVSHEVAMILDREASADTSRLLNFLSLTYALTKAICNSGNSPRLDLAGQHRTEYLPAGDLLLAGVGSYPFETGSGFQGLTTLFWEMKQQRFYSWSESRPMGTAQPLIPTRRYRGEAIWAGGGPPERLSRCFFLLRDAQVNPQRRLSASQKSRVEMGELTEPAQIDFGERCFESWGDLFLYARTTYPLGLKEVNPLERIVILKPSNWGDRYFEELQQRFIWPLHDQEGRTIELTVPWLGVNEDSIEFLEAIKPTVAKLFAVTVQIQFTHQGMNLFPLSLLCSPASKEKCVLNPAFDRELIRSKQAGLLEQLRKKYGRDRIEVAMEESGEPEFNDTVPPAIHSKLSHLESDLLRQAESGVSDRSEVLQSHCQPLNQSGLLELSKALEPGDAGSVLWSAYLCRLHRQILSLPGTGMN